MTKRQIVHVVSRKVDGVLSIEGVCTNAGLADYVAKTNPGFEVGVWTPEGGGHPD